MTPTQTGREAVLAPSALRTTVADRVLTPVTVAFGVVAIAAAVVTFTGGTIPMWAQLVPFAVSILVFGLPHGALDHLVPARLRPGTTTMRSVVTVVAVYLVVGGATATLWAADPLLGFTVFIATTWFHWGQGDLWIDRLLGDGAPGRTGAALTVAARGALPMLVPLAAHPATYATVIQQTTDLVHAGGRDVTPLLVDPVVRWAAAAVALALVVAQLVALRRSGRPTRRTGIETVVLAALFTTVPPVLAVGLYFTLWHAVRHILRLELTDPVAAAGLRSGERLRPFLRFLRRAWPITAIAVVGLVVLGLTLHDAGLGVYLLLIAALTAPHTVVVAWMDRRQRTWSGHPTPAHNERESTCSTASPPSP